MVRARKIDSILWSPPEARVKGSRIVQFIEALQRSGHPEVSDFHSLHTWSVNHPESFWQAVWDFVGIKHSAPASIVLRHPERMPGAVWFEGARLNFAENLLRFDDDRPAIIFRAEDSARRTLSFRELRSEVSRVATYLKAAGVTVGDRIAGYIPNMPEAVIGMLATASIGAVWSSCSPDFGVAGALDRFGQIEPKVLLCADGYFFKGAKVPYLEKVADIARQIPSIRSVLVAQLIGNGSPPDYLPNAKSWSQLSPADTLEFEQLPFNHPLYIMYSSGTTGKPKCIVHSAGGTLIEHLKELTLHTDLGRDDVIMYQTTTGWMMWNWLVSALAVGSTIVLYDGSPIHRGGLAVFDTVSQERVSAFGTNAKFLALAEKEGIKPRFSHDLTALKTVLSTGSVLLPESFDYVYREFKQDLCLSSISGGTDIIGCFSVGCPILPVYRGEAQCKSLGYDVQVFSSAGKRVIGEKGELVCVKPFPSMPIYFWDDADGARYRKSYFERFPGVWHHGDFVEETPHGGHIYFGRSDATLKPGGVRIGTAEIYRQVETMPEITESVVVGQEWEGDVRVVLFVKLSSGLLSPELCERIRSVIRTNASPFHVPRKILQVRDVPRTRSNKIAELAVRDTIHGRPLQNTEALANPECLEEFRNRPELTE